jgi:hypothetical protein
VSDAEEEENDRAPVVHPGRSLPRRLHPLGHEDDAGAEKHAEDLMTRIPRTAKPRRTSRERIRSDWVVGPVSSVMGTAFDVVKVGGPAARQRERIAGSSFSGYVG